MISSLTIKDVASFNSSAPVQIANLNKKVNLFFGLNGAGKSTIANFLQNQEDDAFKSCSINPAISPDIELFVYNQKYVENNFYQKQSQEGIFTVGEESKEVQLDLDNKNDELTKLNMSLSELQAKGKTLSDRKDSHFNTLKEAIWEEKKAIDKSPLRFCLKGYGTKDKFLSQVLESNGDISKKLEDLEKEIEGITDSSEKRIWKDPVFFDAIDVEQDELLSQKVIGSGDSYLSAFINELDNIDWVKKGKTYLDQEDKCPFCQQDLQENFKSELSKLFDQTYEKNIERLKSLHSSYSIAVDKIEAELSNDFFNLSYVTSHIELHSSIEAYISLLKANIKTLEYKINKPSTDVYLESTSGHLENLNEILSQIKDEAQQFNEKIDKKDTFIASVITQFWQVLNQKCQPAITLHQKTSEQLETELERLREQYKEVQSARQKVNEDISNLQDKAASIESSITQINCQLKSLGINSFHIESIPDQSGLYRLARNQGSTSDVYDSLSEGEKTLITFLYFVESCFGTNDKDNVISLENRIVVIDDPISSLSHNYVYDIASIIHHKVIADNFMQVFVLTHNLYFFHELLMLRQPNPGNNINDYNLFRVFKSNHSNVLPMKRNDLQNDYQTYWQIVKDCKNGLAQPNLLPNAIRNILEHYFNFIHKKEKLKQELEKLGEEETEFKPLFRYISREGHSDSINLFDTGAINTEKYIEKFEQVFEKLDHIDHFNKMITED